MRIIDGCKVSSYKMIDMNNKRLVVECPFLDGKCKFPDMFEKVESSDFVGCKIVDYSHGNDVVHWVCPYFPVGMSITAVREAFMRVNRR